MAAAGSALPQSGLFGILVPETFKVSNKALKKGSIGQHSNAALSPANPMSHKPVTVPTQVGAIKETVRCSTAEDRIPGKFRSHDSSLALVML